MKITISPTQEFFRTEEGFLVRLWHGSTDSGAQVFAYVAAIAISAQQEPLLRESAIAPIPGPEAIITEVTWDNGELEDK